METRTYHTTDKTDWPRGPWDDEPDKEQFEDPTTGFPCLVNRGPLGSLCGYVGIAEGHPWFEKDYDDVDAEAHGGLTYSGFCQEGIESHTICHVPGPGEPEKVWWVGFDCGHYMDVSPRMLAHPGYSSSIYLDSSPGFTVTYKPFGYVKQECAQLAHQALAAMSDNATLSG
jgi:hypothetical protein